MFDSFEELLEEKIKAYIRDMRDTMPSFRSLDTRRELDFTIKRGTISTIYVEDQHGRKVALECDLAKIIQDY